MQGFQDLISLSTLHGVEFYVYQTETALRVLRGLAKKVLILTPPGLAGQWKEEMSSKFDLDFVTHEDDPFRSMTEENAWAAFPFVIASMNYAKRSPQAEVIRQLHYDIVLVDEAHHLRNRTSVAWQFVNALDKKFILLLTATPVQNDLEELFNLVTLLKPGQLKAPRDFKREFVERSDPRKPKNTEMLRSLLADCMVRNTRSQIDRSLPPRRATTVKLRLSPAEEALYARVTGFLRSLYLAIPSAEVWDQTTSRESDGPTPKPEDSAFPKENGRKRIPVLNKMVIQTLLRELGSSPSAFAETGKNLLDNPKLPAEIRAFFEGAVRESLSIRRTTKEEALLSLLRSLGGEKAVVFTHYRRTLENLQSALTSSGISAGIYHGGISTEEKDAVVREFAANLPVLLSMEAGGEGRNLQFCRTLVNYDLPYNPMRIEQRVGRIHRIGQKRSVTIYNLAAEKTLEDYLLKILDEKINMFELVIGEMDMILGQIEEERGFEDVLLDLWMKSKSEEELVSGMSALGEKLLKAKEEYLETKATDEKIFAQYFEAV